MAARRHRPRVTVTRAHVSPRKISWRRGRDWLRYASGLHPDPADRLFAPEGSPNLGSHPFGWHERLYSILETLYSSTLKFPGGGEGIGSLRSGLRPVTCGSPVRPCGLTEPGFSSLPMSTGQLANRSADESESWRRGRDSNPRNLAVHLISNQTQSTTLPPKVALFRPWRCFGALSGCEEKRLPADEDHEAHAGSAASVEGPVG